MSHLEIHLGDAVSVGPVGALKKYPWKKEYDGLDFTDDSMASTRIEKPGKKPTTLGEAVVSALTSDGKNDSGQAMTKLFAICARLEERGLNPDRFTGNTVRLENNVFYVEFPEDSGASQPKVGVRLADGAEIDAGYEELQMPKALVIKKSHQEWAQIQDSISQGLAYDTVASIYGATGEKANFNLRKQLWSRLGKKGKFFGSKKQNRELVKEIGANINAVPDEPVARDDEADPDVLNLLGDIAGEDAPTEDGSAN